LNFAAIKLALTNNIILPDTHDNKSKQAAGRLWQQLYKYTKNVLTGKE
jgi:hypothetical protein